MSSFACRKQFFFFRFDPLFFLRYENLFGGSIHFIEKPTRRMIKEIERGTRYHLGENENKNKVDRRHFLTHGTAHVPPTYLSAAAVIYDGGIQSFLFYKNI